MPAIQLARLRIQVADLVESFSRPGVFVQKLRDLLDFYADRARRPGGRGAKASLMPAYNVSPQVLRHIERALQPEVLADPSAALTLADALWLENWYEFRLLALQVLGWIPPSPPDPIVERIQSWSRSVGREHVLDKNWIRGMAGLMQESPGSALALIEDWLSAPQESLKVLGLRVVQSLMEEGETNHLPAFFNLIAPILQEPGSIPEGEILDAIRALARRSPHETAYFLRQNLAMSEREEMGRLIRLSLGSFPPDVQERLRDHLRKQ